jgi:hypothetical protein
MFADCKAPLLHRLRLEDAVSRLDRQLAGAEDVVTQHVQSTSGLQDQLFEMAHTFTGDTQSVRAEVEALREAVRSLQGSNVPRNVP